MAVSELIRKLKIAKLKLGYMGLQTLSDAVNQAIIYIEEKENGRKD